jgi:hypothetical protein
VSFSPSSLRRSEGYNTRAVYPLGTRRGTLRPAFAVGVGEPPNSPESLCPLAQDKTKMPGATLPESPWLKWPSFTPSKGEAGFDDELIRYKQDIVALYGEAALRQSWLKTCAALKELTDEIVLKGTSIIPEVKYEEMLDLGQEGKDELLKRGAFVVRGVVDKQVADGWFHDLKGYVADNRGDIGGVLITLIPESR